MAGTGRREQNKARTRAAIIVAAVELMSQQGYEKTSTNQIAHAAGIAPSTLFTYFPTKASILFADLNLWTPPEHVTAAPDPHRTLYAMLTGMLDSPAWVRGVDDPLTAARFQLVSTNPDLTALQSSHALAQAPTFANQLHELHPDCPPSTCLALAGAMIGAVITTVNHHPAPDLRHTILTAARTALDLHH